MQHLSAFGFDGFRVFTVSVATRRRRFICTAPSPSPTDPAAACQRPHYEALEETMSTIPLTLIEGAIAMPRLRPLRYVPASFGRDWALLPPVRNWRAELKALYAAVLHTFCLTDQAILSFCQWVPLDTRRAAASLATSASTFERAYVGAAPREVDPRVPVDHAVRSTTIEAPGSRAPGDRAIHWGALAGGACVIGGMAALAWVALGHPEHRYPASSLRPADMTVVSGSSEPTQRTVPDMAATGETHSGDPGAKVSSTTLARVDAKPVAVPAPGMASASGNVSGNETIMHRGNTNSFSEKSGRARTTVGRGLTRNVTDNAVPRGTAKRHERPRITVPAIAERSPPAPSVAGDYSPFAPAGLGVDDYASVTMSAATHLRDIAPGPRAATSSHLAETDGTEWMGRISHRRVTDVPEQFAK